MFALLKPIRVFMFCTETPADLCEEVDVPSLVRRMREVTLRIGAMLLRIGSWAVSARHKTRCELPTHQPNHQGWQQDPLQQG
jgi:hypothetical protein